MVSENIVKSFWDFLEYYPESDEEGYDGIHDGGIKGIRPDAPDKAKVDYEKWLDMKAEAEKNLTKI